MHRPEEGAEKAVVEREVRVGSSPGLLTKQILRVSD